MIVGYKNLNDNLMPIQILALIYIFYFSIQEKNDKGDKEFIKLRVVGQVWAI